MNLKLPFGLKNGKLVSIDKVENGLSCNCLCPACGNRLIAKKGEIKIHHFAHHNAEDCNRGIETALHKLCKSLILNSEEIVTPPLYYPKTNYILYESQRIPIENVIIEKRFKDIVPDILIETKGRKLIIEICVNNSVSFEKVNKIRLYNCAAIEIDAKCLLKNAYFDSKSMKLENYFKDKLLNDTYCKQWIHNPKLEKVNTNLKRNYAEQKEVKSFKIDFGYYNYVEDCPLNSKTWKRGKLKGKPYASIEENCTNCKFCSEIQYNYYPHKRLYNYNYEIPKKVYCLGYLERDFKELIEDLKHAPNKA